MSVQFRRAAPWAYHSHAIVATTAAQLTQRGRVLVCDIAFLLPQQTVLIGLVFGTISTNGCVTSNYLSVLRDRNITVSLWDLEAHERILQSSALS